MARRRKRQQQELPPSMAHFGGEDAVIFVDALLDTRPVSQAAIDQMQQHLKLRATWKK